MRKGLGLLLLLVLVVTSAAMAAEKTDPLAAWQPSFDPSGAEFTYILSNVSRRSIENTRAGLKNLETS